VISFTLEVTQFCQGSVTMRRYQRLLTSSFSYFPSFLAVNSCGTPRSQLISPESANDFELSRVNARQN
jgi:hypothetical protein